MPSLTTNVSPTQVLSNKLGLKITQNNTRDKISTRLPTSLRIHINCKK